MNYHGQKFAYGICQVTCCLQKYGRQQVSDVL